MCKGVRQGCTLSPWLFNVFIDNAAKEKESEVLLRHHWCTAVCRDMVLLEKMEEEMQHNLKAMNDALTKWALKSTEKSDESGKDNR